MTDAAAQQAGHAAIDWRGRTDIEYRWAGSADADGPVVVFLHEGLGSVAMWKDFPDRLCDALGLRGLVYSRPGYGASTLRAPGERWELDFMHSQAREVLPALREALGIAQACWLFGHSDGASIALLHAAHDPRGVLGVIALAPHVFVEDTTIAGIEAAREAWLHGDLRAGLARYHADAASALGGWSGIWLDPRFRAWTIEAELDRVACPVLCIQGSDDGYGTLEQLHRIAACVPGTQQLVLPACGHSPHRDAPAAVIVAAQDFTAHHSTPRSPA